MILIIIGCLSAGAAIGFITAALLQARADRRSEPPRTAAHRADQAADRRLFGEISRQSLGNQAVYDRFRESDRCHAGEPRRRRDYSPPHHGSCGGVERGGGMSLIIKGVDMPKSGESMTYSSKEIIEIPRPHGRLIDADSLIEYINKELKGDEYIQRMFRRIVKSRPTVIEAEVSE